jgi:molybdopterin converting factor subunit 1
MQQLDARPRLRVGVRLFASFREAADMAHLTSELDDGARVSDLLAQLTERIPALGATRGLVALNQTYVDPDALLHDGDEVALIPPVSGG